MSASSMIGWVVVGVACITMSIGVNTRTAFSLLFPPILAEFGWERGLTAGAFSAGFVVSILYAPFIGMLMDRVGPRLVLPLGIVLTSTGMLLVPSISQPWHPYLTLGVLVVGGSVLSVISVTPCFCRSGLYANAAWLLV